MQRLSHFVVFPGVGGEKKKKTRFNYSSRACCAGLYLYGTNRCNCETALLVQRKTLSDPVDTCVSGNE